MTQTKKNPNSAVRLILVLFVISAIVALLLGMTNYITEDIIDAIKQEKTQKALREVMPGNYAFEELTAEVSREEVTNVYSACAEGSSEAAGYVVELVVSGSQGNISMVVGVDLNGAVTGVSIVDMAETAGLGDKAADADWRAQFVGASGSVAVNKDGGQIDALTGATVTSRAVANGVNIALATVAELG